MRPVTRFALAGLAVLSAPVLVSAQQPAASGQQATETKSERRICRRMDESGSLAKSRRVCLTRAQWDLMAERQRANSPTMTAMSGSQSGQ